MATSTLPASTLLLLARGGLAEAADSAAPGQRYALSHLAALRGAAAVLARRARPARSAPTGRPEPMTAESPRQSTRPEPMTAESPRRSTRPEPSTAEPLAPRRSSRPTSAWVLLTEVAPELGEWAAFFAAGARKRAAAEAGLAGAVTAREADDLLRDAACFLSVVENVLTSELQASG